jgi:opacity protein-like surface antigen
MRRHGESLKLVRGLLAIGQNRFGVEDMKSISFAVAGTLAVMATYPVPALAGDLNPSFYGGVFAGADFFKGSVSTGFSTSDSDGTRGDVGLLAGIRLQQGDWFYGGEFDASLSYGSNPDIDGGGCDGTFGFDWCDDQGSMHARAIVGRSFGKVDLFAAGGLAAAFLKYDGLNGTESPTLWGYSLGIGAEYHVNDRVSVRVEGLHDQFTDHTFSDGYNGAWRQNTVRAGAIFRFN